MGYRNLMWTCLLLGRLACFVESGHGGGYAGGYAGSYANAENYGSASSYGGGGENAAANAVSSFSSPGCMTCLCQAATGCNVNKQCVGDVCGAFAISWQYWKDAGQPGGDYVSCANNPSCALNCVQNYVNKFAQDCDGNGIVDCADAARLHRLGRAGCSGWLDNEFASRLSSCDASAVPPISSIFAQAKPGYTPNHQNQVGSSSSTAGCSTCSGSGYVGSSSSGSGNVGSSGSAYTGSPGSNGIAYGGNSGQRYVGSSSGSGYPSVAGASNGIGYVGSSGPTIGYIGSSSGSGYASGSGASNGIGYVGSSEPTGYVGNNYIGSSSGSSGSTGIGYVGSSGLRYSGGAGSSSTGYNPSSTGVSRYVGSTGVRSLNSGSSGSGYSGGSYSRGKYPQSAVSAPVYPSPGYQVSAGSHAAASVSASASLQSSGWQGHSGGSSGSSGTGFLAGGSGYNPGNGYSTSAGSYAGAGGDAVSDHCLSCICNAATGCSLSAGCNHAGCGPLRISKAYWIDAGSPGGDYEGCTNNMQCSMNCAKTYMTKYAKDCDGDGVIQCGDYARVHRLGAYGCHGELDWQFHSQINTCSA